MIDRLHGDAVAGKGAIHVSKVDDDEILFFVERHTLMGRGLGLIDVHLLASATLGGSSLWTTDRNLRLAARSLGIEFGQHPSSV